MENNISIPVTCTCQLKIGQTLYSPEQNKKLSITDQYWHEKISLEVKQGKKWEIINER